MINCVLINKSRTRTLSAVFLGLWDLLWPEISAYKMYSRFLTFDDLFDLESNFFEKLMLRASFWGIFCLLLAKSEILLHMPLNVPEQPQGFFSNYKKIMGRNRVFLTLKEKKIIMPWFFKSKTNLTVTQNLTLTSYLNLGVKFQKSLQVILTRIKS